MAELSPEEKQRIYLEEKARLEARQQVRASKLNNGLKGCLVVLGIVLLFIIVLSFLASPNKPAKEGTKSEKEATVKPSCDTAKAEALISKFREEGIIYKIDAPPDLYPRVYVTEAWQKLPMDQKKIMDGVLYCWGSHGGAKDIIVKYYDYRTEEKIALGGRGGLSLK